MQKREVIIMNSKQRMLTALHRGKPDRLPVTVHQWQGYHLDEYMGGVDALDAFEAVGMDASIQYFADMGQFWLVDADYTKFSTPEWRDEVKIISDAPDNRINHHTITTPESVLTYKTEGDRKTTWITEYLIKQDEDIDLIRKYMPVPALDPKPVAELYDRIGDKGILRGFVWGDQAGCWQHAACLFDIQDLIYACFDKPGWVHELLKILLEKKLQFVETMKGARFDVIETGGGSASSTVISKSMRSFACRMIANCMMPSIRSGSTWWLSYLRRHFKIEELIVGNGAMLLRRSPRPVLAATRNPGIKAKIGDRLAVMGDGSI
jgi:hypothetical protein